MSHRNHRLLGAAMILAGLAAAPAGAIDPIPCEAVPSVIADTTAEPIAPGAFEPTWDSLRQYEAPDWFRDAKFGIWAHWGPQCQPENNDWYARQMYQPKNWKYKAHIEKYGHPSVFGFKDVIHEWKAGQWDPDKLVALYKSAGARYFFAMGNHHDNLDLWDSKYQPWNSVAVGPKKDILAGWAAAAKKQGLPFGVSIHAAHAWSWYEPSQGADAGGEYAGVPYDGKLTKADGKGKWWEGLDPQDLYCQNHTPAAGYLNPGAIHGQWNWGGSATPPDQAYCDKFYNRTMDMIGKYHPDLIYFDDTALPLWPVSDAGLKIAANYYNDNMSRHGGKLEAVLFGKILNGQQRDCLTWDIERGAPNAIQDRPWQTCTCIGSWHYSRDYYNKSKYKSAGTVIHILCDVVSKNGNLLLNIPVRGNGSIDGKEIAILEEIKAWIDINGECIYGTRPWKVFGEGPATEGAPISAQGFNEGKGKPLTAEDVRFTKKGNAIYAIVMGRPEKPVEIKSLGRAAGLLEGKIQNVRLLGVDAPAKWKRSDATLTIEAPSGKAASDVAVVYAIELK